MAQLELPLPEVNVEDFLRAWKRSELVATVKEWNPKKRDKVLPTLLCGKLIDIYISLNNEITADLADVRKALMKKAGLVKDPLVAGKEFMVHSVTRRDCRMFCRRAVEVIQPSIPTRSPYIRHFATAISYRDNAIHRPVAAFTWKADDT